MQYTTHTIILALLLILSGCGAKQVESNSVPGTTEVIADETITTDTTEDPYLHVHSWQGNLDGKYPVLMWYKEFGDVLTGSLFYTENKKAQAIRLIGTIKDKQYRIVEIWPDGKITGIWSLEPHRVGIEGSWISPETGKEFNASMMHIDTAIEIPVIEVKGDVSGEYAYRYTEDGGWGSMMAKQHGGEVTIRFDNISQAPANNLAILDAVTLPLKDNIAIYRSSVFGDCAFRIRFFNDFVVVDYLDNQYDCGFGNGAGVDGVYIKVK